MEEKGDGIEQYDFKGEEDKEGCFVIVVVIVDFVVGDEIQLSFSEGDELIIFSKEFIDWWWGEFDRKCGYIFVFYVILVVDYVRNFIIYYEW